MSKYLSMINEANDIKKIEPENYKKLAKEIRRFLIVKISKNGGHLASNLGAVELTMALHLFLDFPEDKLIWDVGHQSYTHKILTGRKDDFDTLRQYNGLSGFPKHVESDCDCFDTGHSSTSLSVACGFTKARDMAGKNNKVVAVIGDGALSGGMAFEALNNAGRFKSNMIVVLNDNKMSISENVGGMAMYLGKIRTNSGYASLKRNVEKGLRSIPVLGPSVVKRLKVSKDSIKQLVVPGMMFENMGFTYIGPIDGHNIEQMLEAFDAASVPNKPVLVHVVTTKGKGYRFAETNPEKYHGIGAFDPETGETVSSSVKPTYTDVFSNKLISIAEQDKKVVAITAAMAEGTGLNTFEQRFRNRFYDVGIAEEHAVTFAAGLASDGFLPVVAIYSTFLQRAYDQILHDVCKNRLHVIFAIDRAGIVGNDGETHQGIYDLSYLSSIPGLTLMSPKNDVELEEMLEFAYNYNGPCAIRYPRGSACCSMHEYNEPISIGKAEIIRDNHAKITLLAIGSMNAVANDTADLLKRDGIEVNIVNMRFVSPLDKQVLSYFAGFTELFVTMEENVKRGGFGESVTAFLAEEGLLNGRIINVSLPDSYLCQGKPEILKKANHLDAFSIYERIKKDFAFLEKKG